MGKIKAFFYNFSSYDNLSKLAMIGIVMWIISPLQAMLFNYLDFYALATYNVWILFLYIPGAFGWILGGVYLSKRIKESKLSKKEVINALLPIILLLVFGLWNVFCSCFAENVFLAFFGKMARMDCVSVYACLFGMIMNGLVISSDKRRLKIVAWWLLAIAIVLAIFSLLDNDLSFKLFDNNATNCHHYEAVYYNTNHYGYHLTIILLVCAYLIQTTKIKIEKAAYIIIFVVQEITLILNDTFGSYLAVLLTLAFAVIWSFINKESDKKGPILILTLFVIISAVSLLFVPNVKDNFSALFGDLGVMSISTGDEIGDIESVGSGRGQRWKWSIEQIKTHPFIGQGLDGAPKYSSHNIFLQIMVYSGIPGVILYLSVLIAGVIRLISERKSMNVVTHSSAFVVVGYLISAFFGVTMFYTSPYFYTVFGVCLGGCLKELNKSFNNK